MISTASAPRTGSRAPASPAAIRDVRADSAARGQNVSSPARIQQLRSPAARARSAATGRHCGTGNRTVPSACRPPPSPDSRSSQRRGFEQLQRGRLGEPVAGEQRRQHDQRQHHDDLRAAERHPAARAPRSHARSRRASADRTPRPTHASKAAVLHQQHGRRRRDGRHHPHQHASRSTSPTHRSCHYKAPIAPSAASGHQPRPPTDRHQRARARAAALARAWTATAVAAAKRLAPSLDLALAQLDAPDLAGQRLRQVLHELDPRAGTRTRTAASARAPGSPSPTHRTRHGPKPTRRTP